VKSNKKSQNQLFITAIFRAIMLSTAIVPVLNWLTLAASAAPVPAKSADAFVDSIGVNTHLDYTESPYARFNDLIKPKLQELGVRHIRDGVHLYEELLNKLKELSKLGIKSNLVFSNEFDVVVAIAKATSGSIEAVEGPNESDLEVFNFSYNGQKFPEATRAYQQGLYTAIKNDPATKYLPVVLPSMGWGDNSQKLGYLKSGDYCNIHSYPNLGARPTHDIDWYFIPNAQKICGRSKPMIVTETGYHNAIADWYGLSEQATSKYLPRLLLENFNRNIKRTYLYELIDQGTGFQNQDRFGLLRYDGSPKPAFTAIRNLISLLKEPGANFAPKSLDYTLGGNNQDLHSTLLQKSTGEFYLILWQDAESWNDVNKKDVAVGNQQITVKLNTFIRKAEVYQPRNSTTSILAYNVPSGGRLDKLGVSVPDHPLVIKLVP
jgi:hypothetical protein